MPGKVWKYITHFLPGTFGGAMRKTLHCNELWFLYFNFFVISFPFLSSQHWLQFGQGYEGAGRVGWGWSINLFGASPLFQAPSLLSSLFKLAKLHTCIIWIDPLPHFFFCITNTLYQRSNCSHLSLALNLIGSKAWQGNRHRREGVI